MENEIVDKQWKNSGWKNILPHQFKKGQSGNPEGRPAGKTLKEYSRDMLAKMTDEERQEFLNGLSKETIWKLAEGNPSNDDKVKVEGTIIVEISKSIADKNGLNNITGQDSK